MRMRRPRSNFSEECIDALEKLFSTNPYPDINERESMALRFHTEENRIQVSQNHNLKPHQILKKKNSIPFQGMVSKQTS